MTMEDVNESSAENKEFSTVDLASTPQLSDKTEDLAADKLLDELPLPQHQKTFVDHTIVSPARNNYDQFFEEVSLDLPSDTTEDTTSPSRLMKFMPRRNNTAPVSNSDSSRDEITSSDISGPFYSISDVLDDTQASASTSTEQVYSEPSTYNPRAARRNVNEAEVIVTSGGSSMPVKGRSSLNIFRRKSLTQKPSPLETVISKTRPRMLPPKDPQEEKKHLQEYEAMMKKAKKLEMKKQKENDKKREQKDRRVKHALYVWEKDIIPNWKSRLNQTRTIVLWNQGIPARCRKRVWALRIGNPLNVTKTTFNECVRRVPLRTKANMDDSHGAPMPIVASNHNTKLYDPYADGKAHDPALYSLQRRQRTSSLDVLRENNEDSDHFASTYSLNSTDDASYSVNGSVGDRSTTDLGSNSSHADEDGNIGLEDDDGDDDDDSTSQEEDIEDDAVDDKILKDPAAINYLNKAIDEDILRTLPSLCVFQPDGPLFLSLRKVLYAYVGYRPSMTYPRGTSFLAGVLLLNMNAQDAFTSLVNLISRSQILSALYNGDEKKIQGYFKIFNVIFAENLPKLYLHFKNLTLTPENYLPDWFMTIFASIVPLELSSRLWDLYLLHGDIIMFRTGLTVLKYLEPLLWGGGFSETVKILNMGFVGEHRGEEVQAALAVSGHITDGDEDPFFDEILGRKGVHLDRTRFRQLLDAHMPRPTTN